MSLGLFFFLLLRLSKSARDTSCVYVVVHQQQAATGGELPLVFWRARGIASQIVPEVGMSQ